MRSPSRTTSRLAQVGALALVAVWAAQPATGKPAGATPTCALRNSPLEQALRALPGHPRVTHTSDRDADSQELIERDAVVYSDGTRLMVEQRNCAIYNLRLTLELRSAEPTETDLARFAAVLATTPVWRNKFAAIDAGAMVRTELSSKAWRAGRATGAPFSYSTDALPVTGETSETLVSYAPGRGGGALTLEIAAGD